MDDPLIGQQLGNYRVERLIGRGGMASVYYGWDVRLERPAAIKVIDTHAYWGDDRPVQRFVEEARLVATWRHENIAQVYAAGDHEGLYYFVMEYIDGQDLAQVLANSNATGQRISTDELLRMARAIARALDYAHQKGVVHRDVKPSNILVAKDGRVVLSDFGLALDMGRGSQGEAFGTPHYISPEQARRSSDAVPQSDLYSMGVILYEMLTGVVPFDDPSPTTVALQHMSAPLPRPASVNPELNAATDAVLEKALAKNPEERYASGQELVDALEEALLGGGSPPAQPGLPPLPAAVVTPSDKPPALAARRISLAERLRRQALPEAQTGPAKPRRAGARWQWKLVQTLVVLLLVITAGLLLTHPQELGRLRLSGAFPFLITTTPSPQIAPGAAPRPTATASSASSTGAVPGKGATLTHTPPPSTTPTTLPTLHPSQTPTRQATASRTPTPSRTPTRTTTPSQTLTPSQTPTEQATASQTPTLTPTYTRLFKLYYDANSFYLVNASGSPLGDVRPLAFERLDLSGQPRNRFEGQQWLPYSSRLDAGYCNCIEIEGRPTYLRPPECLGKYRVTRTPPGTADYIFWTYTPDSKAFRVLWYNEPAALCQIADGVCTFYLP